MAGFFQPVEFNRNELRQARLQSLAEPPAHGPGIIYFDTAAGRAMISDGANWLPVGGIVDGSVGTPQLGNTAVTQAKLANGSVGTAQIIDGNVTTVKIADGAVTGGTAGAGVKIAANTITNANISTTAAIAKSKLAALAIVDADVAAGAAIAKSKLAALAIVNADIAAGAGIDLSKLATNPLARANHTGTQVAATISDFATVARSSMTKATIDALSVDADTVDGIQAAALEKIANKNVANGYAGLDAQGKIPDGLLPALAISDVHVVATQAAMLALNAQVGDVAIRTDEDRSYILRVAPATTLANWEQLRAPQGGGGTVTSVGATPPLASTGGVNPVLSITTNGITANEIGPNAVGASELADNAVDTAAIANLAVTLGKLAADSVDATKIVNGSLTTALLANGAVTTAKIGDGQVTDAKIASVDISKVTGAVRKVTGVIGNNSATSFDVAHGLGTDEVIVQVSETVGTKSVVYPDIRRLDVNTVRIIFTGYTPAAAEFTVIITG